MIEAKDKKREKLLEAGIDLLSERPFSRITMNDIAKRSGMTKPMVYYYFGSKEGFYRELTRFVMREARRLVGENMKTDCSLRESLESFVRMRLDVVEKNPKYAKAVYTLFTDENIGEYIADLVEEFEKFMEIWDPLFEKAIAGGEIRPDTDWVLAMEVINASVTHFVMHFLIADKLPAEHIPEPEGLIDLLFRGIQSDRRPSE